MIICPLCGEDKPDEEFSVNTQHPNRLHFFCKECDKKNEKYLKINPKVCLPPQFPDGKTLNKILVDVKREAANEVANKHLEYYRSLNPMYEKMQKLLDVQQADYQK